MSKQPTSHVHWIVVIILVVIIIAAASAGYAFWLWHQVDGTELHGKIRIEVIKVLLHLAIVVVIGGLIALALRYVEAVVQAWIKAEEDLRKKSQLHSDVRSAYLARVGAAYRAAKSVRRLLRAGGLTRRYDSPPTELSEAHLKIYRHEMERLNDAQLQLEELKVEARVFPAFREIPERERPDVDLKAMEDYLRTILKQYEEFSPKATAGESITFERLDALDEFTDDRKDERPFDLFCKRYDNIVKTLSRYLE